MTAQPTEDLREDLDVMMAAAERVGLHALAARRDMLHHGIPATHPICRWADEIALSANNIVRYRRVPVLVELHIGHARHEPCDCRAASDDGETS